MTSRLYVVVRSGVPQSSHCDGLLECQVFRVDCTPLSMSGTAVLAQNAILVPLLVLCRSLSQLSLTYICMYFTSFLLALSQQKPCVRLHIRQAENHKNQFS